MPPKTPRQRTAAQRKAKPEDEQPDGADVVPISTEEQEAEIRRLRQKNARDSGQAQNALDLGVMTIIFMTGAQFLRILNDPSPLKAVAAMQLSLLPLSLTPHWLPLFKPLTLNFHAYIAFFQIGLFIFAFQFIRTTVPDWGAADVVRWAMPELIAGAVEIQRRGERESERKVLELEELKYNLKGA